MCSDSDIFSFGTAMSSNSELGLVKENQEDIKLMKLLHRPSLEFSTSSESSDENGIIALQWGHQEEEDKERYNEREEDGKECKNKDCCSGLVSLGELKATDDDNDGFRTPTTSDHKIPVIKQCPPAPRKPRPVLSSKRKASQSNVRRSLQLDLSRELESLFPIPIIADFYKKMKKARRDDQDSHCTN